MDGKVFWQVMQVLIINPTDDARHRCLFTLSIIFQTIRLGPLLRRRAVSFRAGGVIVRTRAHECNYHSHRTLGRASKGPITNQGLFTWCVW